MNAVERGDGERQTFVWFEASDLTTPAATLRAAAAKVRELAKEMDTRRLTIHQEPDGTGGYTWDVYAEDATDEEEIYSFTARHHAEWFATMSPAIAEPVAVWLETTADVIEARPNWLAGRLSTPAIALARAILGGEQP